jgi:hypothetical protein
MQTNTLIPFPRAGWLGSRIKAATVRRFIRKATKPKLKATPQMLQAVKDRFRKG